MVTVTFDNADIFKRILIEARNSLLRERERFLLCDNITPEMQAWADEYIYVPLNKVQKLLQENFNGNK